MNYKWWVNMALCLNLFESETSIPKLLFWSYLLQFMIIIILFFNNNILLQFILYLSQARIVTPTTTTKLVLRLMDCISLRFLHDLGPVDCSLSQTLL